MLPVQTNLPRNRAVRVEHRAPSIRSLISTINNVHRLVSLAAVTAFRSGLFFRVFLEGFYKSGFCLPERPGE